MREAAFIKENRDKWDRIDIQNTDAGVSAEDLAENFVQITDDLSYARTFYPGSQTVRYLNQLAARYFIDINRYKSKGKNRFLQFWLKDLPEVMYEYRKCMLYSFIFLMAGALLGIFSQQQGADFANMIMGENYMSQTHSNIGSGDPMAIYKSSPEAPMFVGIATNNIRVAFYALVAGIFLSIGTVYILFSNGVMLGVFQYFFAQQGLLGTSMASIWLHGTLEISAIVIAGGAGIAIGNSILFPGTRTRAKSLRRAAAAASKIVLGLVPIFVVAAFIESYWTRLTDMPVIFNIIVISLSAIFIIGYFFVYPYMLNKKTNNNINI